MIGLKWHSARLTLAAAVKFAQIKFLRRKDDSFVAWRSKYKSEGEGGMKKRRRLTRAQTCAGTLMGRHVMWARETAAPIWPDLSSVQPIINCQKAVASITRVKFYYIYIFFEERRKTEWLWLAKLHFFSSLLETCCSSASTCSCRVSSWPLRWSASCQLSFARSWLAWSSSVSWSRASCVLSQWSTFSRCRRVISASPSSARRVACWASRSWPQKITDKSKYCSVLHYKNKEAVVGALTGSQILPSPLLEQDILCIKTFKVLQYKYSYLQISRYYPEKCIH